ncbi:MAG: hypothetical protein ABI612_25660, partial [Betaproteobacteria bacterium]
VPGQLTRTRQASKFATEPVVGGADTTMELASGLNSYMISITDTALVLSADMENCISRHALNYRRAATRDENSQNVFRGAFSSLGNAHTVALIIALVHRETNRIRIATRTPRRHGAF